MEDKGKTREQLIEEIKALQRQIEESRKEILWIVMEQSPFSMWISDSSGTVTRTNRALREKLNVSDDKILGKYNVLRDANLEEQGVMPQVRAVFEQKRPCRFTIEWKAAKGGPDGFEGGNDLWIDVSIFPILDSDGNLINAVCQWVDITKRKKAEEDSKASLAEIAKSRNILDNIINLLPLRIFWKDKDLKYLGCNKAFAKDAGMDSPNELIGKDDYAMGWKDQADLYRNDDRDVIADRKAKLNIEEPQTTPTGETIWLSTSKVPLTDEKEEVIGVLGAYADITEKKNIDIQMEKLVEELQNFKKISVGRELRMIELKKEINKLSKELGRKEPYKYPATDAGGG